MILSVRATTPVTVSIAELLCKSEKYDRNDAGRRTAHLLCAVSQQTQPYSSHARAPARTDLVVVLEKEIYIETFSRIELLLLPQTHPIHEWDYRTMPQVKLPR